MMAKLESLAERDSCTEMRRVMEIFMTHFCLVTADVLAGTVVAVGAVSVCG